MVGGKNILVVEDEKDLAELLCYHLEREGYACRRAEDGERALSECQRQPPDLIILDRMLPKLSGDEVVSNLKRDFRTADIPIIVLTAKAEETDELVGFALGVDDYLRKPFAMKLILARVAAVLRRGRAATVKREVLTVGAVTVDRARHEVTVAGKVVGVTATELRILALLMAARGRVLSREQLIDDVIGHGAAVTNRAMDVHIASLRRKLGRAARCIHTVRGVGYSFRVAEGGLVNK